MLRTALAKVVDVVYPPVCAGCGRRGVWVCDRCLQLHGPIAGPICERCGMPGTATCMCRQLPEEIDRFRAAFVYAAWVPNTVHRFKYQDESARSHSLAQAMLPALEDLLPIDALIPVSLHPRRRVERGYDQALLIAEALGSLADLPVIACLERTRYTTSQVGQGFAERRANVHGAFRLRADHRLRHGSRIALVDDVRTTGATLSECGIALLPLHPAFIGAITYAAAVPSAPKKAAPRA